MLIECVRAWRKTRHPRWAALADWCTDHDRPLVGAGKKKSDREAWHALEQRQDPHDLPRLYAALRGMASTHVVELLPVLARWNDPRSVTQLLGLLEKPQWSARTALPFFRAAARELAASRDVRARDGMLSLGDRYKTILLGAMGDDVGALLRRIAAEMKIVEPELTRDEVVRVAELEAQFPAQLAAAKNTTAVKQGTMKSDQALLETIWAAPDDDGPRLVFADVLQQRGDVRGELITLQVARARGNATNETRAREYELLANSRRFAEWTSPVSQGGDCHVRRGFPSWVQLSARGLGSIATHPAWATVTAVTGLRAVPKKHAKALFESATSLTDVGQIDEAVLELAGEHVAKWRAAELAFMPAPEQVARLASLERLTLSMARGPTDTLPAGWFAPFTKLKRLRLIHTVRATDLPPLEELFVYELKGPLPKGLQALHADPLPALDLLAGSGLLRFGTGSMTGAELAALLAAVPTLRQVELSNLAAAELGPVLRVLQSSQLDAVKVNTNHYTRALDLEARWWSPTLAQQLATLHDVKPKRVLLKPHRDEPLLPIGAPQPTQLAAIESDLKPLGIPLEVAWY
ncbi:MAG: TIGR02996 domain-containing protein [Myxococcaceae bacterium]|nr:TIGR02996 domain-containing protein [Myxococcaceae bacterium]